MSSNKKTAKKEIKKIEENSKLPLIISLLVLLGIGAFATWYFLSNSNNPSNTTNTTNGKTESSETIAAGNPTTPTEAYKKLFAALKAKDKATIKSMMSKDTLGLAQMQAGQSKKDIDEVLKNGFFTANATDKLPAIRDERVKGRFGAIEVFSKKQSAWENMPFIIENGMWKLAVGNLFGGSFKSPGKPRTTIEKENANAAGKRDLVPLKNKNANINVANIKPKVIDTNKAEKLPGPPNKVPPPPPPSKNKK